MKDTSSISKTQLRLFTTIGDKIETRIKLVLNKLGHRDPYLNQVSFEKDSDTVYVDFSTNTGQTQYDTVFNTDIFFVEETELDSLVKNHIAVYENK